MAIAGEEHDPLLLSEAHLLEGLSLAWRVDLPAALDHFDKAVDYAGATRSGYVDFRVGPHPAVVANMVSGLTRWLAGSPQAAAMQHALDMASDLDTGLACLEEGFEQYKGLSAPPMFWPALLMIRASALAAAKRGDEAMAAIEEAEAALQSGDPLAPVVGLIHGDLLLEVQPPDVPAAEAAFERVARLAGRRGAKVAQLRALTRLAVLRRGTPGEGAALRDLREVYDSFTDGLDMPHLTAARATWNT